MKSARELAAWVREHFGDELVEARVFGSVARGDATEDSDVDVFFLFKRPLTLDDKMEIGGAAFDIDMRNDTWIGWLAESVERWRGSALRGSGIVRAVEREGVAV